LSQGGVAVAAEPTEFSISNVAVGSSVASCRA